MAMKSISIKNNKAIATYPFYQSDSEELPLNWKGLPFIPAI